MRQSGRTTRMLLAAAIAVSEGKKVLVVGFDTRYSQHLASKLLQICHENEIPVGQGQVQFISAAAGAVPETAKRDIDEIFVDHTVYRRYEV